MGNVCSAAGSEVKAEIGWMVLWAAEEAMATDWAPVQGHHSLETGTTEQSVQVCLQLFVCEQTVGKGEMPRVSVGVWQVKQISRARAAFWVQSSNLHLPGLGW